MTVTLSDLNGKYAEWFRGTRNAGQAKAEILRLFGEEPGEAREWTEQDICEQSRKIIARWNRQPTPDPAGTIPDPE